MKNSLLTFLALVLLCQRAFSIFAVNRRKRHAPAAGDTLANMSWPGQKNLAPFMSQWGAWSDQQIRQGIGQQPFQPSGIQINPGQAHWYPNAPEYHGFDASYIKQLRARMSTVQPGALNDTRPGIVYWPLLSTTTQASSAVQAWGTWARIQNQGVQGGVLRQWVNWYQNPDLAAQGQEYLAERQRQFGTYPDGQPIPADQPVFPDDTDKVLVNILAGFVAGTTPKKAAMHNMRTYYTQYRRYYWVGKRFFDLDPQTTLDSFVTCTYDLPADVNVVYEVDDTRVKEILFQCVKYQEICCKLNCCNTKGQPLYYASFFGNYAQKSMFAKILPSFAMASLIFILLF